LIINYLWFLSAVSSSLIFKACIFISLSFIVLDLNLKNCIDITWLNHLCNHRNYHLDLIFGFLNSCCLKYPDYDLAAFIILIARCLYWCMARSFGSELHYFDFLLKLPHFFWVLCRRFQFAFISNRFGSECHHLNG